MMTGADLFREYNQLAEKADNAFAKVENEHSPCIKCEIGCTDCCYSVFGLFLIEAVHLKHYYDKLPRGERRDAVQRAKKADKQLQKIEERIKQCGDDPGARALAMGKERVRCPLLKDDGKCMVYSHRPITCRVYGIPTVSRGQVHVCYKAGFTRGKSYPTFNLDNVFKKLYILSCKLLAQSGQTGTERAASMLSVSKVITTPVKDLIKGI
jgi:Fe-S-cluster containining protein